MLAAVIERPGAVTARALAASEDPAQLKVVLDVARP
jgi:hypothetical protein